MSKQKSVHVAIEVSISSTVFSLRDDSDSDGGRQDTVRMSCGCVQNVFCIGDDEISCRVFSGFYASQFVNESGVDHLVCYRFFWLLRRDACSVL